MIKCKHLKWKRCKERTRRGKMFVFYCKSCWKVMSEVPQ